MLLQEAVLEETGGMQWGSFKTLLADAVIAHLQPIQQKFTAVMADEAYLDEVRMMYLSSHLLLAPCTRATYLDEVRMMYLLSHLLLAPCTHATCLYEVRMMHLLPDLLAAPCTRRSAWMRCA